METHRLIPHYGHPPRAVTAVEVRVIGGDPNWLRVRWRIAGSAKVIAPPFAGKGFADGLWRTTCFELFLRPDGGERYVELNLSPSERWAAYDFTAPRTAMSRRPMPRDPEGALRLGQNFAIFDAAVPLSGLPPRPWSLGLTCVIEEEGGVVSYWALSHPPGNADFHDPACFTARVLAADIP